MVAYACGVVTDLSKQVHLCLAFSEHSVTCYYLQRNNFYQEGLANVKKNGGVAYQSNRFLSSLVVILKVSCPFLNMNPS